MVDLLEKAIEKVKKLPAHEQTEAAELLMDYINSMNLAIPTQQQLADIEEAQKTMLRGDFASEKDVLDLKRRHGLI